LTAALLDHLLLGNVAHSIEKRHVNLFP